MVLAYSLRDNGTKKKLAVLVTLNCLQASTITELKKVYDYLIPVDQIVNKSPANLYLMNRPDLGSTFTKIALWRQTRFEKIVYLDADMVALRAPDELFDQPSGFAAVPDIGWPDCFNSGLLVLSPNMGDYYGLLALAQRGISFDGADQGLLNMRFRDWHRLSFTYNCTPSGNYQYMPAYRHFQSSINIVHYIGTDKPWRVGRDWKGATGAYEELLGRWWAVYDKYYRAPAQPGSRTVQQYVQGETTTTDFGYSSIPEPLIGKGREPEASVITTERPLTEKTEPAEELDQGEVKPMPTVQQRRYSVDWDPIRQPPPPNSKPEASNFPNETYHMSSDRKLFQPPSSYPAPPKNLHYQVPSTPPSTQRPKPIFPWEENQAKPSRVFPHGPRPSSSESAPSITTDTDTQAETTGPVTPTIQVTSSEPFATFSRTNAWDEMPEIERYIANLPINRRRAQLQGLLNTKHGDLMGSDAALSPSTEGPPTEPQQRRPSLILTDFPTEFERPSLPVTPAPIPKPTFWGQERNEAGNLPRAEGVPEQSQWDSAAKLLELQRRQTEMLNAGPPSPTRDIPDRSLPKSSVPVPTGAPKAAPTATAFPSSALKAEVAKPDETTTSGRESEASVAEPTTSQE
ncbi:MAG: hypothetical protein LQ348_001295 [Seirophora lacunosa]|nr:MAG: hypothetical protein LQ348_001295 [Seirophora lacunosa]